MNTSIVAIPLLAAIWLGVPAGASAQEPSEEPRETKAPRVTERRAVERPERPAEPRARAVEPRVAAPAPPTAAAPDDQRRTTRRAPTARPPAARNPRDQRDQRDRGRGRDDGPGPRVAVPRPRGVPPVVGSNYRRPTYYPPASYDRWARQTYRWSPLPYAPWSWIYGSVGLSSYGYYAYGSYGPYGYDPYGYGYRGYSSYPRYGGVTVYDTGNIRLRIRPRDAMVFVNGYYAGLVDDFDGTFQSLRLEQGGHKLEIRMPGYETLELDIHVQAGRTISIREDLIPRP